MVKGILRNSAALLLLILVLAGCSQAGQESEALARADSPTAAAQAAIGTTETVTTDTGTVDTATIDTVDTATTGTATITLAPGSGYAGTFVDVSGEGWPPSALVLVKLADEGGLSSVLAAIAADAEGRFTTGYVYPVGERWLEAGAQTVLAHTEDGAVTAMATFTVVPPEGVAAPTATTTASPAITPAVSNPFTATVVATMTAASAAAPTPSITATIALTAGGLAATPPYAAVEPFAGRANTAVTVRGGGFPPNTPITIALVETRKASEPGSLEHIYATATTDSQGNYRVSFTLPATWPDGTLVAEGQIAIVVATADHRRWASVPFDHLGNALPVPYTASPLPTSIVPLLPTGTSKPSTPNVGDETKVTLCHRPPGNPNNAHTIIVDQSAVPAHLGHEDTFGACIAHGGNSDEPNQGKDKQKEKDKGIEVGN